MLTVLAVQLQLFAQYVKLDIYFNQTIHVARTFAQSAFAQCVLLVLIAQPVMQITFSHHLTQSAILLVFLQFLIARSAQVQQLAQFATRDSLDQFAKKLAR